MDCDRCTYATLKRKKKEKGKWSDFLRGRSKPYPVVLEGTRRSVGVGQYWALLNQHCSGETRLPTEG